MKTYKNSQATTAKGNLSQSEYERAVPATNTTNKYEVVLILAQKSSGSVIIEATTPEEARQKASQLELYEVQDWNVFEDEMSVESVQLTKGDKSHD